MANINHAVQKSVADAHPHARLNANRDTLRKSVLANHAPQAAVAQMAWPSNVSKDNTATQAQLNAPTVPPHTTQGLPAQAKMVALFF